jgi:4-hydroxybenzoate polyprenyltransferase
MDYNEQDLQDAIAKYHQGRCSMRSISREFGIPSTTLFHRIHGTQARSTAAEPLQTLSRVQEDHLAQWVLTQQALGVPPTHAQIREFAGRVLQAQGASRTTVGKGWMTRFIRRNPVLRTQRARKIDSVRINGATDSVIRSWWPRLNIPAIKAILPANRYNFDEFGIMEGQGTNGLVVGSSQTRAIQRKVPGSRAWTSFLECISATGVALPPAVIFKGKSVQQQWFPIDKDELKEWKFTATDKGWINRAVALEWLEEVFIPRTQPSDPSQSRLLILDGHDSHTTDDFMWACYKNNIQLLFLPPHTSHVLQPLDLSIFSPLKHTYRKLLNRMTSWTESTVVGKQMMIKCIVEARKQAITAHNIKAGWRASGLWPVHMAKPLMSRLLMENSNKVADNNDPLHPLGSLATGLPSQPVGLDQGGQFSTPRKKTDLRGHLSNLAARRQPHSTRKLLFQKVEKAFDQKDFELAHLRQENEALKIQLEVARPSKRKKVVVDPNNLFASIEQIHQAQIDAGRIEGSVAEESGSESAESDASCIVVG